MSAVTNQSASSDPVSALHHLVLIFEDCPDFRADNDNKAHLLSDIIVIALCAVMGGANFWTSVERFGKGHEAWFRTFLTLENGIPSHDTFQRVFAHLDPEALNSRFGRWTGLTHCVFPRISSFGINWLAKSRTIRKN